MKTITILIVGVTGALGQLVARVCREKYGATCFIVGTYFSKVNLVPSTVDAAVRVDVSELNWFDHIALYDTLLRSQPYDLVFYCFTRGSVGFPAAEATFDQQQQALAYSYDPLNQMEEWGITRATVVFDSFTELPLVKLVYGAVAIIKERVRVWVSDGSIYGTNRYLVRLGAFMSESANSIWRFVQHEVEKRRSWQPVHPLVHEFGHLSPQELRQELTSRAFKEERDVLGSSRPTEKGDIVQALMKILGPESKEKNTFCAVGDLAW